MYHDIGLHTEFRFSTVVLYVLIGCILLSVRVQYCFSTCTALQLDIDFGNLEAVQLYKHI